MEKSKTFLAAIIISLLVLSLSPVLAGKNSERICLKEGQVIPIGKNNIFTCTLPLCSVCLSKKGKIINDKECSHIPECVPTPPLINILNPLDNTVHDERRIDFIIELDEFSEIEFTDITNSRISNRRLCFGCIFLKKTLSFRDGFHLFKVRATNRFGDYTEQSINFIVDSKQPRILKTFPKRDYATGEFKVEFKEDHPTFITLYYGNTLVGYDTKEINPSSCKFKNNRNICSEFIDLSDLEDQGLEYWFSVEDISGHQTLSRIKRLTVDTIPPRIIDISHQTKNKRTIFTFQIEDENFKSLRYIDHLNPRTTSPRRLCSRLRNSRCSRTIILRPGPHDLEFIATDKAGNSQIENLFIEI